MLLILGAALPSCSVGRAAMIGRTSLPMFSFRAARDHRTFSYALVVTSPGCKYAHSVQIKEAGSIHVV